MLVLLNAFFVVAEFSLVKVRRTRLEELIQQGNKRAQLALKVTENFESYLGATQLGITLASLALGWLGEPAVASIFEHVLIENMPESRLLASTISIAIGFIIITFLHIVLGELVPKAMAIQRAESLALLSVYPLYLFQKIGYPIIILFNRTARALLSMLGIERTNESELTHSEEELRLIVNASHRGGVLDKVESELIDNVFDFADRLAREVMVPRQDMVCLFLDDSIEDNMKVIREIAHTRYPLCIEDKDHVIGMIHIRDLFDFGACKPAEVDLRSIMREILMVPEGMSVPDLLQVMRRKQTHLAVVVDEYGGTAGLVAMEDLIEEIVGDIKDEHDENVFEIQHLEDGSYEFDGKVLLDEVVELLDINLTDHEEDTIGGYIFGILGRRPEIGDQVQLENYNFEVLMVNGFRVMRVKAARLQHEDNIEQAE